MVKGKTATEKRVTKNGNGRNDNRKIGQLEKSATKNESKSKVKWSIAVRRRLTATERVGKQGNKKLMCEITATGKRATEKNATGKWATENWTTGKFGNEK